MKFATDLGPVSDKALRKWRALASMIVWRAIPGREYLTAELTPLVDDCKRAFFIKIPPKCAVKRHTDNIPHLTDHVVIDTNANCLNWWLWDGEEVSAHLEEGRRYRIHDRSAEHWATNDGSTDRIHLLIEH